MENEFKAAVAMAAKNGYSRKQIAELSGMPYSTLCSKVNGYTSYTQEECDKIFELIGKGGHQ